MPRPTHTVGTDLTATPPSLSGRFKRDPVLWFATGLLKAWFPAFGAISPLREGHADDGVRQLRIVKRERVASDDNVIALTLTALDGTTLPMWRAGAHLDLMLPSGRMREYSLCGDPADGTVYRIAVRRIPDGGGGSIEVHDSLSVGDVVSIKGPRNAFPLALPGFGSAATRLRFIAGGIGITPILPMLASAQRLGLDWSMIYTGRSVDSLPFRAELAAFGDKVTIRTDDDHGLPTMADLVGDDLAAGTAVYACGPVPMLDGLRSHLADRPDVELHYERFSPPPVRDGRPFTVRLAASGREVAVGADESALAAVRREVPSVPYSCQQGFCGTCKVRCLDGEVDHRDTILSDDERADGYLLTCVSRAQGDRLTLDI